MPVAVADQADWVSRRELGIAAPVAKADRLVRWWAGRAHRRGVIAMEVAG
jgi:hypothetical protein